MPALLSVEGVEAGYGDLVAVRGVSLEVGAGEVVALVGSNGAGKTTLLRAVSGLLPLRAGRLFLDGQRLDGLPPTRVVARGVAHVPEGRQLFPSLTVLENLELGAGRSARDPAVAERLAWVFRLFPRLEERRRQLAGTLSGGEQQMVGIGRGLMARPRLLLLDEPSLGLAPVAVRTIFDTLRQINAGGTAILLVEQNVLRALQLSHRGYVLENGQVTLAGSRAELLVHDHIRQAYLGR
jgi:branched-chain amino acid transport system ATP-binding protein